MAKSILEQLKEQDSVSREDIAKLLKSIGKPGQNQEQKVAAIEQLDHRNFQGIHIVETLPTYGEF